MKKLLFVAALGVAGLMSAKDVKEGADINTNIVSKSSLDKNVEISKVFRYHWVSVVTGCGAVFYLDYNMYDSYEAFQEDARYFTDIKCGEGECFDVPF